MAQSVQRSELINTYKTEICKCLIKEGGEWGGEGERGRKRETGMRERDRHEREKEA